MSGQSLSFQVNATTPSTVGGTGTSVKYFPRTLSFFGPGGAAPTTPSSSSAAGALFIPAQNVFAGQNFQVRVAGSVGPETGDASGTVTVKLYAVTGSFTSPTYTALAGTGTLTPTAADESFSIVANLFGDTVSGVLTGWYTAMINGAFKNSGGTSAVVAVDNNISSLDFLAGNPSLQQGAVLGLVVGVTFGTSDSTNTAKLYQFDVVA